MADQEKPWVVETGKGKSTYNHRYTFTDRNQAVRYYNGLNTHSGYKKRLVRPDGTVEARVVT